MGKRYVGLHGSSKGWLVSKLHRENPRMLVLCKDRRAAEDLVADLQFFTANIDVLHLVAWDTLPFEPVSPQTDVSADRIRTLDALLHSRQFLCVTAIDAVMQKIMPRDCFESSLFQLRAGERVDRARLISRFDDCGFQRVSLVEDVGDLAVRGGVVDFFPSTSRQAVRLELLGDRIERMRTFDVSTQRASGPLQSIRVLPVRELYNFASSGGGADLLHPGIQRIKSRGKELETPPREIARLINALRTNARFPGIELSQAIAFERMSSLFDFIPEDCTVALNDEMAIDQSMDSYWELLAEREQRAKEEHGLTPSRAHLYDAPEHAQSAIQSFETIRLDSLELLDLGDDSGASQTDKIRSLSNLELATRLKTKVGTGHALQPLRAFIDKWRKARCDIAFVVGSDGRAERLHKLLLEIGLDARVFDQSGLQWLDTGNRYPLVILFGHLSAGVQLPDEKLIFISENEIFNERSYRKTGASKINLKRIMSSLAQLKEGDYVVHSDYGIGIYKGLTHLTVEGSESDFLWLEYADSRLYLPVHSIGKVQKFVAAEGQQPSLDKLSSNRWSVTKQKVKEAVVALAGDLIKLYASRSVAKGWRFEPEGAEDERFADGFPFEETPDQRRAIAETLSDMATERPMDRLVCGDVGFGKTEVAMRAAFKCLQHVRQVAVLAPTTILVEQLRANFAERFMGYDVEIAALSRFYKSAENKETLEKLASGELDIVIGTQRLLSRDVEFKDLGLVIVDEEHRFGVKQKEALKQLKKQVDVLSLTATPIPRTLHMSLLGIRDISVISTPPRDRRLIRTYVAAYSDNLVRDAVLRELQRGGQCFFLHNRVQSIPLIAAKLTTLVPEARCEFAHGQMTEQELEAIMQRFLKRETDILVSTTIIESGIDIPNANTILIDRADTFGLAQLYQLRGRVGRSTRQAYAYLLIPKSEKLGADAQKRLKVLQSLDDLGLGFNLAIRDLEIRGAGNLLGKEQSGNVLAVGYELYGKILKEAVLHLKGEEPSIAESIDPELKLGTSAYIPDHYIPDISERLVLYQRLAALASDEEADEMKKEIEDRFGPPGREVANLIELMRLRCLLREHGIVRAELGESKLLLAFSPRAPIDGEKIMALVRKEPEKFKFSKTLSLRIGHSLGRVDDPWQVYELTHSVLRRIRREEAEKSEQSSVAR